MRKRHTGVNRKTLRARKNGKRNVVVLSSIDIRVTQPLGFWHDETKQLHFFGMGHHNKVIVMENGIALSTFSMKDDGHTLYKLTLPMDCGVEHIAYYPLCHHAPTRDNADTTG